MEKNFTNDHFEDFLRQNADSLRMRPSEKVWEEVSKDLNKGRRRFGWGLSALLLAACTLGYLTTDVNKDQVADVSERKEAGRTSIKNTGTSALPSLVYRNKELINETAKPVGNQKPIIADSKPSGHLSIAVNNLEATPVDQTAAAEANPFSFIPVDSDVRPESEVAQATPIQTAEAKDPLSIESVVNVYKPAPKKKKPSLQWYFTPTISYRKLSENKSYLRSMQGSNAPAAVIPTHFDVNSIVTHKPGMGLEFGVAVKYPISKKISLRAGAQLNMTRYEIKAFSSTTELTTIMLNSTSRGADSMYRISSLNTKNGYREDWLQNLYFQVSAPIGAEFIVAGNDKVQFGIATTIQPTYVLSDKAYLISADYRKYAEVPELTRRWNVNTALETFVAYSTGKLNWQVGPQVRYQLLSSFATQYPVKENLFDFGLRVGISLNSENR